MPMSRIAIVSLVLALSAGVARADTVHLVGGNVIDGKAERKGDKVVVELESGEVTLPAESVEKIERSDSVVQRFEALYAKLAPGDVKGLLTLANFCRDHDMRERERQMLLQVIEHAPDQAEARARLGYVHTEAGWITRDEQMRAQGLVQHDGQWVTREHLIEIERLEAQAQTAAHERDKAEAELEAKRLELQKARESKAQGATDASAQALRPQPMMVSGYYSPYAYASPVYTPSVYTPSVYTPTVSTPSAGAPGHCLDPPLCSRFAPSWGPPRRTFPIAGVRDPFDYLR
ncbi:MAG: hypothetical protein ACHQ53_06635 [Polyangiales bacterium]